MKKMRLFQALILSVVILAALYSLVQLDKGRITAKLDPRVVMAAVTNPSPASPGYMMVNLAIPGTQTSGGVIGTKTNVSRFKMPWPATLLAVSGIYRTGGAITVDVTEAGSSVLSIPLLINSTTKASEGVIADSSIADEALIGINIVAEGLCYDPTVQLIFKRK